MIACLLRSLQAPGMDHVQLVPKPRGSFDSLAAQPVLSRSPAGGVLLRVRAVGLNFRDVLNVLGMYPGDPGAPGGDFAGVFAASGAAVFGLAPGCLGAAVWANPATLAPKPSHVTFEEACSTPTTLVT